MMPTLALPCVCGMSQLTSLKIKRMPVAAETHCLGALTSLRHLLWDPALAVDIPCEPTTCQLCLNSASGQRLLAAATPLSCSPAPLLS